MIHDGSSEWLFNDRRRNARFIVAVNIKEIQLLLESHDEEQLQNPGSEETLFAGLTLEDALFVWFDTVRCVTHSCYDCRVTARESAWSNDSEWNKRRQVAYKPRNLVRQTPICNKFVLKFVFLLLLLLFFVFLFNFVRRGCAAGYSECRMLSLYQTFNSLLACVQPPPSLHQLYTG